MLNAHITIVYEDNIETIGTIGFFNLGSDKMTSLEFFFFRTFYIRKFRIKRACFAITIAEHL